jgi:hypothetical protein
MSRESAMAIATPKAPEGVTLTQVARPGAEPGVATIPVSETLESTPVDATPEESQPQVTSSQVAQLAKKEARIFREREEIKKQREEIERLKKPFVDFNELFKADKIQALRSLGFTETDIINFAAGTEPVELTPEQKAANAADERIKKWENDQADKAKLVEAKKNEDVISHFRGKILPDFITKNAEKYEYCKFNGPLAVDLIYRTMDQILKDSGELISLDEATAAVEAMYEEEDKEMTTTIKKRKPPVDLAPSTEVEQPLKPSVVQMPKKTLTGNVTATAAATANRKETHEQKRERIIEQIRQHGLRK